MKTSILLLFIFLIFSCKKNTADTASQQGTISLQNAVAVKSGDLVFSSKGSSTGEIKIYKQSSGDLILAIEQASINSDTDLEFYLSATGNITTSSIRLFSFKAVNGSYYFALPKGFDASLFNYAIIHTDKQDQPIATAQIS